MMTKGKAPKHLSGLARRQLYETCIAARDASDLASAHASVGDVDGLLYELHRGIAHQISAIKTLQALGKAQPRPALRLVA